jgi:hypothetical protein
VLSPLATDNTSFFEEEQVCRPSSQTLHQGLAEYVIVEYEYNAKEKAKP